MKRKGVLVLVLLIAIFASGSLFAASTFSIGSVNYYSYFDLEAGNSEDFIPGIRAEFFFSDYLGVSADALVLDSVPDFDYYEMMYIVDVVLRFPLGLIEPYIATGPAYFGYIWGDETVTAEDSFAYNVRGGVDFNILDWLSVGAEVNFLVPDVAAFFENIGELTEEEIKENSLIGISAKIKF
jgi:hypothetical protein